MMQMKTYAQKGTGMNPKKQSGMFVIEALVSVLLIAVGLVGLMIMAAQASTQAGQSKVRNDASYLAGELIGEMWVSASSPGAYNTSAWASRLSSAIPGATATVSATGNKVDIDISWPDKKEGSSVRHHYRTSAQIEKNS